MHHFHDLNGALHAEGVPLDQIAQVAGTPTYVYSTATLTRHYNVIANAFAGQEFLIAFSIKSCPNAAVVATLAQLGSGADVVSGGELRKALRAGIAPEKVVFSGVGKTRAELAFALDAGIGVFNVESEPELDALNEIAAGAGTRAPIAFRVNPDVAAGGHAKISTGKKSDKFGVPWDRARDLYAKAGKLPGIEVVGVDMHIGSQIEDLGPFEAAARKIVGMVEHLRADGHAITRVDIGGGLGIPYKDGEQAPPEPSVYAELVARVLGPLNVHVTLEPGRVITGNAGVLLTRVIYVKDGGDRRFVIIDAGMNDLIRPALYDAWHEIRPVNEPPTGAPRSPVDVVGPVCESSDLFARARPMPPVAAGDLLAIMSAGAYGS
ncbi:MAG: diaminopimelate decarboxylase, partial [Maricaulaceae bacterium]